MSPEVRKETVFFINLIKFIINLIKTFMKKLFTLLGAVLMASSSFGQEELIINGNLEGEQQPGWSSFWVQDTKVEGVTDEATGQGKITHSDGKTGWLQFADIVQNPFKAGKCVKVHVADKAESQALGTARMDGNTYVAWNTQFYLYLKEAVPEGKWITLQMKVRSNRDGSMSGQAHMKPNGYTHYTLFTSNDIAYEKNKWTKVWRKAQISSSHTSNGDRPFQAIAFNLAISDATESFDIYFDDISVVVTDEEPQEPVVEDTSDWINFMRRGIYSMDNITGVDGNGNPWHCTNFTVQDLTKPEGEQQQPAPVVEVPGESGVYAVKVPVMGYKIVEEEDLDADGNQQFDDDGNIKMKSIYYWNNGTLVPGINGAAAGSAAPARWMCQFFVSTLHKMKGGERYKFKFQVKADKATALGTQAHYGPGQYKAYNTFGGESDFPVGTDWTTFDLGEAQGKTVPSDANGCQTITFDCVPLQGDDNNFYFIFEECSFTEKNVTMADRTLGTPEYLVLPYTGTDDAEMPVTIDASTMLNTYEENDFNFLNNGKDGVKLLALTEPEDPDEDPEETFSSVLSWTDGGFVDAKGYYLSDSENGILIHFDSESINEKNINLMIWNNPDSGISFADGNVVTTTLAISQGGWYYIYNIALMSPESYKAYQAELENVIKLIDAIDETVTLESKAGIETARKAYNALPEYGQKNVTNYDKLTAAEAEYKILADIKNTIDLIDAIGTVEYSEACKARIDDARSAYDALSDASKEAITNYQTLVDAEAKYAELEAAGISTVTTAAVKNGIMYDLMGRQITKATKGLYILNGKKYIKK